MQTAGGQFMDNKELIKKSALDLFYARGYDAVGVQEIVNTAGITKPTLYYYFGSKRGLLENLIQSGYQQLEDEILDAINKTCFIVLRAPFLIIVASIRNSIYSCCLFFIWEEKMKLIRWLHL